MKKETTKPSYKKEENTQLYVKIKFNKKKKKNKELKQQSEKKVYTIENTKKL